MESEPALGLYFINVGNKNIINNVNSAKGHVHIYHLTISTFNNCLIQRRISAMNDCSVQLMKNSSLKNVSCNVVIFESALGCISWI